MEKIPVRHVGWNPCVRIVPTRYPPVALFEQALTPSELDAALELAARFDPAARVAAGQLSLVPPSDRALGVGAGYVMAPFLHLAPEGTRFTDGTFGAYHAANDERTAIAETRYHRERFFAATQAPPQRVEMRVLHAAFAARLHDLRGLGAERPDLYDADPARYASAQAVGRSLREAGANGIVYDSVRQPDGQCVAIFRPRLVKRCRPVRVLSYAWDGERIAQVYEIRLLR